MRSTTLRQLEQATGRDKLVVLASTLDQVIDGVRDIESRVTIDSQIETLDASELAEQYGVTMETFRKQVVGVMGEEAIFKLGKKWVIRKRKFLEFLQAKESESNLN